MNWRHLLGAFGIGVVGGAIALASAQRLVGEHASGQEKSQGPSTLSARAFNLVDAEGKTRITISVSKDGYAGVGIWDGQGKKRVVLGVAKDGSPGISFYDGNERQRGGLGFSTAESGGLGLYDSEGRLRASLGLDDRSNAGLTVYGKDGRPIRSIP